MAIIWNISGVPFIDENGDPYAGMRAFFFDAETSTPRVVYRDGNLNIAHDQPILANAAGAFPAVFLPPGAYRQRVEKPDGSLFFDDDNINTPIFTEPDGGGGDTDPTLLMQTGMLIDRYGTGTMTGWVRANGRTIGNASSGATERANADCENLFAYLWTQDGNLVVSGGRGGSAAGDWAAGKQIALPDLRLIPRAGLGDMGATVSTRIDMIDPDPTDLVTLGKVVGDFEVGLEIDNLPSHTHTGSTNGAGSHSHTLNMFTGGGAGSRSIPVSTEPGRPYISSTDPVNAVGDHSHSFTTAASGNNEDHANVSPMILVSVHIKL